MENTSLSIESEYIKNLQQQIYFLELEANFLREQTKKAINLQPLLASEMEHMLQKLQTLQCQADSLHLELKRKKSGLNMLKMERNQLNNQINMADEHHLKEKQVLVEEITQLKREKAQKDEQISVKQIEISYANQELEEQQMNLKNKEQAILMLKTKERVLKEEVYTTHSTSIAQFLTVKDQEEHLQHEIKRHQEILEQEMSTFQELEDKISILEKRNTTLDLNIATLSSQVAEARAMLEKEEQDNIELKRENSLLIDFASNLKKQLAGKENSLQQASNKILELDEVISALKMKHTLHQSLQSDKWDKISKMANSMKKFNNSVADIVDRMSRMGKQ
ncbi:tumor protein D53 isoform X3 [Python bivittatus]|uniref:Tumor protein D53 isoform X3 n=1 Tax=Python bivittatus TaxID=176946 RepID=A0A9F5JBS0_PYTBI|nr:tumor protein D53 isoform X3 [Python bivittatus]